MPQNQETAATLIARAQQRYTIPALPGAIQSQIGAVCDHNDSIDPAKVPASWVVTALTSRGYDVDVEKLDRICIRDLGRVSFLVSA